MRVVLGTALLHFAGLATGEGILEEGLGPLGLRIAPAHWQGVLMDMFEVPGVLVLPDHTLFPFVARNIALKQARCSVLEQLTSWR